MRPQPTSEHPQKIRHPNLCSILSPQHLRFPMRAALALFALLSAPSRAQTPAAANSFVIADVHPSPFTSNPFMHGNSIQGDRYFLTQATMLDLIATAYGVDGANVQGGPSWLERDRYDIRAKVPAKTTPAEVKLMLRGL